MDDGGQMDGVESIIQGFFQPTFCDFEVRTLSRQKRNEVTMQICRAEFGSFAPPMPITNEI